MAMGNVARQSLDADGRMTGTYHDNPFLNTITENVPKTLSKAPCLVAKRMSPTLHLLLFAQSM